MLPQVFSRFIGFATYQLDSNLRNSTMVGIVGAGGIGGTLFAAFQRFDYDYVCAILISIIALIMVGEVLATAVRAIFIDNATLARSLPARRHRASARATPARTTDGGAAAVARSPPRRERRAIWRRFTPAQRLARFVVYLVDRRRDRRVGRRRSR